MAMRDRQPGLHFFSQSALKLLSLLLTLVCQLSIGYFGTIISEYIRK
jgi:hypothetical protein